MSKPQKLYVVVRTDDSWEPRSNPVAAYLSKRDADSHAVRAQEANFNLDHALNDLADRQPTQPTEAEENRFEKAKRRLLAKNKALLGSVWNQDNLYSVWEIPLLTEVPQVKL